MMPLPALSPNLKYYLMKFTLPLVSKVPSTSYEVYTSYEVLLTGVKFTNKLLLSEQTDFTAVLIMENNLLAERPNL